MADEPICPCDGLPTENTIANPPGRDSIGYRVGDFSTFRHALLKALDGEQQLVVWRPGGDGDLGVQMVEWWAYIGDILTFYNERIANEAYLRTATLPESVNRLIRTIGYRPRPGIAARGQIAALAGGYRAFTLPEGFSVDSKPGPGETPQTFELDADTAIAPQNTVKAEIPAFLFAPSATTFLVLGTGTAFAAGDVLRVVSRSNAFSPFAIKVNSVAAETGDDGKKQTRVTFAPAGTVPAGLKAIDVDVQFASQASPLWSAAAAVAPPALHLAGVARDLHPGDTVALTSPSHALPSLHQVSQMSDVVWYSNHPDDPTTAPTTPANIIPLGVLHSKLVLDSLESGWTDFASITVRFGWRSVGTLLDQPAGSFSGGSLAAVAPAVFPDGLAQPVLIADSVGEGVAALGSVSSPDTTLALSNLPVPAVVLQPPLVAHFNVLAISRGKTVSNEVLGSGNATQSNQEFVLKKSPLTYLAKGDGYVSTLELRVGGRLWSEVPSFYQQPADAEIFVTAEDEDQKTHVKFGDGVNGARLPTGIDNVTATYRYGSGAKSPLAGEITVINKPYPNLKSVQNPVAVGGGADPDPPDQIKRYAPPTVLTFGRAISGDDYESIAGRAPGVTRVQAVWSFDATEQRSAVKIYVGDDQPAVDSARAAIALSGDPHRHVVVAAATAVPIALALLVLVDDRADPAEVETLVRAALLDDLTGLFGPHHLGIGQAIFHSAISAACLACDGAQSLRGTLFLRLAGNTILFDDGPRYAPGEGAFFSLDPKYLFVFTEVDQHAG